MVCAEDVCMTGLLIVIKGIASSYIISELEDLSCFRAIKNGKIHSHSFWRII